jgi:hypothetical protein
MINIMLFPEKLGEVLSLEVVLKGVKKYWTFTGPVLKNIDCEDYLI